MMIRHFKCIKLKSLRIICCEKSQVENQFEISRRQFAFYSTSSSLEMTSYFSIANICFNVFSSYSTLTHFAATSLFL